MADENESARTGEKISREALRKARALSDSISSALAAGCTHYACDGRLLKTPREILEALLSDNEIQVAQPGQAPPEPPKNDDPHAEVFLTSTTQRVRCNNVPVRLWVGQLRDGTIVGAAVACVFLLEDKPSEARIAEFNERMRECGLDPRAHEPLTIEWSPGGYTTEHGAL